MTMTRRLPLTGLVLAVWVLGGCATGRPHGNFVATSAALDQPALAAQATRQLAALWPPARTRFALTQPAADTFGAALVGQLRAAGYAVQEAGPVATVGSPAPETAPVDPAAGMTSEALPLRYVLDHDAGTDLYRLTLSVGEQSITRAYLAQGGTARPAGAWVRRE